ncbi:MAG TPA: beta-ketoacyl synthase N-terminal-like domain-containing protein, partial [Pyrinomonadaceae bacterium]|nr:beta-ketoacyl synthase N-terminal-like domain-containing protein [Pyrinomonadaceae bacterium]
MQSRIVITGIGVVTSIGTGREQFWENLLAGRSGVSVVESFDTSGYSVHRGTEVKGFNPAEFLVNLDASEMGRASQFAIAAARLALADAALDAASLDPPRVGVSLGTTSGEPREVERFDDSYVNNELDKVGREFIGRYPCHLISAHVAEELGFAGVNMMIPTACAAGNYAIAHAFDVLRRGRADVMLAGGS